MNETKKEKQFIDLQLSIDEAKALFEKLSGLEIDEKNYKKAVEKIAWYICE